jgi:hypothetical protein
MAGTVSAFTPPSRTRGRAYGGDGLPKQPLYLVAFPGGDAQIYADVFEHWLEAE